jgi:tetrahydromethanopterin S-methyltransferase subunit G
MIDEHLTRIENKLDKIETKLDNHLERLSKAETSLEFVRGHLKISTAIFISVVGVIAVSYWDKFLALVLTLQ